MSTRRQQRKEKVEVPKQTAPEPARPHEPPAPDESDQTNAGDVDEASEESFPASDPPSFTRVRVR